MQGSSIPTIHPLCILLRTEAPGPDHIKTRLGVWDAGDPVGNAGTMSEAIRLCAVQDVEEDERKEKAVDLIGEGMR